MLQKLSLFSLVLGVLLVAISACSKPTSDAKAKELAVGTWEGEFGNITFEQDGKVCATPQDGKKSCGTYNITKDNITIEREGDPTGDKGVYIGGFTIFGKGEYRITLPIIKLTKKEAKVRFNGRDYTLTKR